MQPTWEEYGLGRRRGSVREAAPEGCHRGSQLGNPIALPLLRDCLIMLLRRSSDVSIWASGAHGPKRPLRSGSRKPRWPAPAAPPTLRKPHSQTVSERRNVPLHRSRPPFAPPRTLGGRRWGCRSVLQRRMISCALELPCPSGHNHNRRPATASTAAPPRRYRPARKSPRKLRCTSPRARKTSS
jgi:hypothetical protein